jgi:S-adenosylmethionine decarboxylase
MPVLFEGPEKKLEVLAAVGSPSLRGLGNGFWEDVVARSQAEVLSRVTNADMDAYLLSESSLFVTDRWFVMITCGRTTLVSAAEAILDQLPLTRLDSLIYERKNENFPHLQRTTFAQDVAMLRQRVSGGDMVIGDRQGDHIALFHLDRDCYPEPDDTTLEVLMYGIDPAIREIFAPGVSDPATLRRRIGLTAMFPGFIVDDHLFDPHGYSYNGIQGPHYATLHVTPQQIGSYVSFETNYRLGIAAQRALIERLLACFRPQRCDLLLFGGRLDPNGPPLGFEITMTTQRRLGCGYSIDYAHVERRATGAH